MFEKVCYQDGWHYSVVTDENGNDVPGERLVLEDDGSFRLATEDDINSWHDRKHQQFASVVMEDQSEGLRVTAEEMAIIQETIRKIREG